MYQWWVFVHLVGVFGFLIAHGVSVAVTFQLRREREPARISSLLQLSGSSIRGFYISLALLLGGGVVAGFLGHWWSQGWIWASLGILIVTSFAMYWMARPFYRRVGYIARAMAGGSKAVTSEQFDEVLRSPRPYWIAGVGFGALLVILYLMLFKPTFGLGGTEAAAAQGGGTAIEITAKAISFHPATMSVSAGAPFTIAFDNEDGGVPHNIAIYTNASATRALFRGATFQGPKTVTYQVRALPAGRYFFRCDVHPQAMTGTLVVAGG